MSKKFCFLIFITLISALSVFASITMPHTGIVFEKVNGEGGIWRDNDLTANLRKSVGVFADIKNDVLVNVYMYPEQEGFDEEGFFYCLSEFSGMDFVFSWSAVRVMGFLNTRKEVEYFQENHVKVLGGTKWKITEKKHNSKTGEYYYKYKWIDKNGETIHGRSYGTYYKKETLYTLTVEWKNEESKNTAREVLKEFTQKVGITYEIDF